MTDKGKLKMCRLMFLSILKHKTCRVEYPPKECLKVIFRDVDYALKKLEGK